jgi:hypothetical protein
MRIMMQIHEHEVCNCSNQLLVRSLNCCHDIFKNWLGMQQSDSNQLSEVKDDR